jgi:hypothetical protein
MFIPTLDGSIENMAIETPNPLIEKKNVLTSQVEGAQILPCLQTTQKVLIDPQIIALKPSNISHY